MKLRVLTVLGEAREIQVPDQFTLPDLREAVAKQLALPLDRLKLVKDGAAVAGAAVAALRDGDSLLAVVVPRATPQRLLDLADGGAEEEDEELFRLRLPANAPRWKRRVADALLHRARLPEFVVAALFAIGWRFWAGLAAWAALSRVAAAYEVGPLFIISTIFLLIVLNLGTRKEGSLSAYSLFNPGQRRLPGQITAEALDGQLRHGQM